MAKTVSKRLNFDDITNLPLCQEDKHPAYGLHVESGQVDRKRRRYAPPNQGYRRRRESVCSESDSSLDGFNSDDPSEVEVDFHAHSPTRRILHEVSLPINNINLDFTPVNRKPKGANVNPFSPDHILRSKRRRLESCSDREELFKTSQAKQSRLSLAEISIKRYESEFLELKKLALGSFGQVVLARHRLDGVDYAVKISKKHLRAGSHEEKAALNEVFAHATLNNHKHVVRYYNSWVEEGQVYIQNEFCQGGSLSKEIEERRESGENFSEDHLVRILSHALQGLQYIHSNNLAHLDIKPDNVFISFGQEDQLGGIKENDYKIGDLGHIVPINGESTPEEGDCRYMAPEFLTSKVNPSFLIKADIFSLGLTLYEAASLKSLPRNSSEDPSYQILRSGNLPRLDRYSDSFNTLLRSLVSPDPSLRPSAAALLADPRLNLYNNQTKSQLYVELKQAKEKLKRLQKAAGR